MRHTLLYIVTVILLCGVTVSCDKKEDRRKDTPETVIMFFPYSALESFTTTNIECMKKAIVKRNGLSDKRLIVYRATSVSAGILYEITYEGNACHEVSIANVSATFNSNNQEANLERLKSVLNKIKETAPAMSYSMIIGCHGSSWLPAGYDLMSLNHAFAKGQHKSFGTGSSAHQLDNSTLVKALTECDMPLEYLLFDACYMASVETAYSFRNICKYYIASQNEILSYGMPYDAIGDALLKHNFADVVDLYYEFYSNYSDYGIEAHYGSLSLINTSALDNLAQKAKEINANYTATSYDITTIQREDGISPTIFFDFEDYYAKICTSETQLQSLRSTLSTVVIKERHTDEFFTAFADQYHQPATRSCGLNTSEPTMNAEAAELLKQAEWYKATH